VAIKDWAFVASLMSKLGYVAPLKLQVSNIRVVSQFCNLNRQLNIAR